MENSDKESEGAQSEIEELPDTILRILQVENNYQVMVDPTLTAEERENQTVSVFTKTMGDKV